MFLDYWLLVQSCCHFTEDISRKLPRLQVDKHGMKDAAFILILIMFIVISMYGQNASGFANNGMMYHPHELRPISSFLAGIFFNGPTESTFTL